MVRLGFTQNLFWDNAQPTDLCLQPVGDTFAVCLIHTRGSSYDSKPKLWCWPKLGSFEINSNAVQISVHKRVSPKKRVKYASLSIFRTCWISFKIHRVAGAYIITTIKQRWNKPWKGRQSVAGSHNLTHTLWGNSNMKHLIRLWVETGLPRENLHMHEKLHTERSQLGFEPEISFTQR